MKFISIKSVFAMSLTLGSVSAFADWEPVARCENGAVRIDVDNGERRNLRLVIDGPQMLGRVNNSVPLGLGFGDETKVIWGRSGELRQTSPTTTGFFELPGVFYPGDFQKFIGNLTGGYQVEQRSNDQIALQMFYSRGGERCDGYRDGEWVCRGTLTKHLTFVFTHEYVFNGCENVR